MPFSLRRTNSVALLTLATLWAGTLVVVGLHLAVGPTPPWASWGPLATLAGLTAIAAGEFVFLVLVADRFFPAAPRRVTGALEAVFGLGLASGMAAIAAMLLRGAGQ